MRSLKALILNATLKGSEEKSNTEALAARVQEIYEDEIVNLEIIRLADAISLTELVQIWAWVTNGRYSYYQNATLAW